MKPLARGLVLAAVLILACCAAPSQRPAVTEAAEIPLAPYHAALKSGSVYRLMAGGARVDIIVRRSGTLQRLGHDHVITARSIDGYALLSQTGVSRADLLVDLRELYVDTAAARSVYGLETEPSEEDISGTAANMHEKVLETNIWPYARIAISILDRAGNSAHCEVTLELKGVSHAYPVYVLLDVEGSQLVARGVFDLRQSDFGIEPLSLLGGALAVEDRLEVSFRVSAQRISEITPDD